MAVIPINGMVIDATASSGTMGITTGTINAAGESIAVIGYVSLEGQATGKVISAAGSGAIYWNVNTPLTWASGSTNLRVGIQDVDTGTGLEDGTFDVHADLVPGVDTLTASTYTKSVMTSGTKTISDGNLIAIVVEMTARGGTDSVVMTRASQNALGGLASFFPYGTADTGAGPARSTFFGVAFIQTDDGTMGWIQGVQIPYTGFTGISFNQTSTPDEYVASFIASVPYVLTAVGVAISSIAAGENFDLDVWTDPYGTPSLVQSISVNTQLLGVNGSFIIAKITPLTLVSGTEYGVSIRPTTNNNFAWQYIDLLTGNENLKKISALNSVKMGSRTNQTGAFVVTQTYHLPTLQLFPMGIDIPSASGGEHSSVY